MLCIKLLHEPGNVLWLSLRISRKYTFVWTIPLMIKGPALSQADPLSCQRLQFLLPVHISRTHCAFWHQLWAQWDQHEGPDHSCGVPGPCPPLMFTSSRPLDLDSTEPRPRRSSRPILNDMKWLGLISGFDSFGLITFGKVQKSRKIK